MAIRLAPSVEDSPFAWVIADPDGQGQLPPQCFGSVVARIIDQRGDVSQGEAEPPPDQDLPQAKEVLLPVQPVTRSRARLGFQQP